MTESELTFAYRNSEPESVRNQRIARSRRIDELYAQGRPEEAQAEIERWNAEARRQREAAK